MKVESDGLVVRRFVWSYWQLVTDNQQLEIPTMLDKCGQTLKGVRWMSWHREAKKDAAACEKLRGAGKQALIRRFLNAETRRNNLPSPAHEFIVCMERTQGTETSKYLQEKKERIDSVSSGERKRTTAQTGIRPGVAGALRITRF